MSPESLRFIGQISPLGKKECLGRAIDRKMGQFIYQGDKEVEIVADDFIDTRLDTDLSVDRIGLNHPDARVMSLLEPLAAKRASKRSRMFLGWAVLKAERILSRPGVNPTPITLPEDEANPYHAEISRKDFRKTKDQAIAFGHWMWSLPLCPWVLSLLIIKLPAC
jgi:hypothetical protein